MAEGEPYAVKALLDLDRNLNEANEDGNTPFHYACMAGNTGLAEQLYEAGAKASEPNGKGFTPLHLCILYGHFYMASFLLSLS